MLRNRIIEDKKGKIKFDTEGAIELPIKEVKNIQVYKCPLRLDTVEQYEFKEGVLTVSQPGRYLVEYGR